MSKKMKLIPELRFSEFEKDGEWKNNTLGDVADRIVDKVGKQKLITVSISAGLGFVSQAEKFSRDISGKQYKNYIHLKKGEFAYNKGNSKKFPQGCVYKLKEFDEAATPNAFICFRFKNKVVPDFYQGYFDNNYHGKQLLKFITSGARMDGLLNISPFDFF
jgi:type I restriction enzyme S subunit